MTCISCKQQATENHHVKTRGSGGTDAEFNLMTLCRSCHTEVHKIGMTKFAIKHDEAHNWLIRNGWQFNEFKKKWTHY